MPPLCADDTVAAPGRLEPVDALREIVVEQQVRQIAASARTRRMIVSRKRARMMQPPFQMRAISRRFDVPLLLARAGPISAMPCAYEQILAAYSASWTSLDELLAVVHARRSGPAQDFDAATRSSFMRRQHARVDRRGDRRDRHARSSATCAVHLPVPFCPALSSTLSTSGAPLSGPSRAKIRGGDLDQERLERAAGSTRRRSRRAPPRSSPRPRRSMS